MLLTQVLILSYLSEIRTRFEKAQQHLEMSKTQSLVHQFETTEEIQTRRVKFRALTSLRAKLTVLGDIVDVAVEDISETGALLRCKPELQLTLETSYPAKVYLSEKNVVEATIRIARDIGIPGLFGARFEDLSLASRKAIREFVNQQATKEISANIG